MNDSSLTALIVGAGPVGLTMAALCHHHNIRCRIVDKSPAPTDKSKALVLWARSLELFDDIGMAGDFLPCGININGASLYGGSRKLVQVAINPPGTEYPRPFMIAQSETERVLTEHLTRVGLAPERSVELTDFTEHSDHVVATLRHADGRDEQVRCDWLIGCDGAHSIVRKKANLQFTGEAEPNDWILADVRLEGPISHEELSIFWHSSGIMVVFPFARDRARVVADMGLAQGAGKPPEPTLEQVQAIVDERGPGGIRLVDPVWLSGFRINERKVADYRKGRIFLCGDAAHIHSPAGGQGMNTGMQDAYNLAWKLALVQSGKAKPALLDTYSPERSAIGDQVLKQAGNMTRVAILRNPVLQFLRNQVLWFVGHLSAFHREFGLMLSELAIHYKKSPLNAESGGHGWESKSVGPGDRVPDVKLQQPGGGTRRLHEILRGLHYDLLLLPSGAEGTTLAVLGDIRKRVESTFPGVVKAHLILPTTAVPVGLDGFPSVLLDPALEIRRTFGARESALALVRPDKYLAYRGQPASWEELRGYLEKYLSPASV